MEVKLRTRSIYLKGLFADVCCLTDSVCVEAQKVPLNSTKKMLSCSSSEAFTSRQRQKRAWNCEWEDFVKETKRVLVGARTRLR